MCCPVTCAVKAATGWIWLGSAPAASLPIWIRYAAGSAASASGPAFNGCIALAMMPAAPINCALLPSSSALAANCAPKDAAALPETIVMPLFLLALRWPEAAIPCLGVAQARGRHTRRIDEAI